MGPSQRPLHLLLLDESSADYLVDRRLHECRADRFPLTSTLAEVRDELAVIADVCFKLTVELLAVHTNDVAQITVPPEDNAEHVVEFGERHVIADRDQADDHRAHLAQHRSQNQAFAGGSFNHHSRLLDRPTPDFLALSVSVLAHGS